MHKARVVVHLMDLGPETEALGEGEAKGYVLQAAAGEKELALRDWQQAAELGAVSWIMFGAR
ncbi:hypothetical protein [Streptomyces subrutilus]|uniref:hypothetical protein n=1 Tax=Streptomyces subrutilus TaxID=36818 RepID=UPI0033FFB180